MKTILCCLSAIILNGNILFGQLGHIAPCDGSHSGAICYGYATGRAAGKTAGDGTCDPMTLYQSNINTNYFTQYADASLQGIQAGDIVYFSNHAAYVWQVNTPVSYSRVAQYSTMRSREEPNCRLDSVAMEFGSWQGYYRAKQISITVNNDFSGGRVLIGGNETDAGSYNVNWTGSLSLCAKDSQLSGSYRRSFSRWTINPGTSSVYSLSFNDPARAVTYTAHFDTLYSVTFQNSFPGESGGTITVSSASKGAPYSTYVKKGLGITAQAEYQVINYIEYAFDHWQDNWQTNPRTFTPGDNSTYTANFTAKPLAPTSLNQVASIGQNVHLTWTDNANTTRVTQYHIYRSCEGGEERNLVATAYKGLQSWTDPDVTVKGTKDGPLITYDVCGVDSVTSNEGDCASVSQYGYYVPRIVQPEEPKAWKESAEMPKEYSVGSYPNPFNPSTTISYSLPNNSSVKLDIYDVAGRKVRSLLDESKSAGYHNVVWNGRDENGREVASGMYLYRFTATPINGEKAFTQSGKLVLMK